VGLPLLAVGLKEGNEALSARCDGGWRTLYLRQRQRVGYQLVGDLRAAGALRSLYTRQVDLRLLKDRLPEASFGQGALAWSALVA